ncbi:DUF815 domain-containing protein [Acetobacterium paludosum]|uniref:DUF815 domain-containing protein n=1 Tax=Acetobacterium paludosum TaxID=52693 RepID=A0A923KX46_9FIRM|nr:ATP-binding protein [Acetobacterium paludosum]MBC3889145.1 DUF815 domain-containing protein [Acetobacterium paludosum]
MNNIMNEPFTSTSPLRLVFFRNINDTPIIKSFLNVLTESEKNLNSNPSQEFWDAYYQLNSLLIKGAMEKKPSKPTHPVGESLWQYMILRHFFDDENPFTLFCESQLLTKNHPFYESMLEDVAVLLQMLNFSWDALIKENDIHTENIFSKSIFPPSANEPSFNIAIRKNDPEQFLKTLSEYIYKHGFGIFLNHSSFKLNSQGQILPIFNESTQTMDDLVGNTFQKQEIIQNTKALIDYNQGLNVLLQGSMGTGKSSTVRALLHIFSNTRLRMIEIKRDQLGLIPQLFKQLEHRPYPFILFIDDLTFETRDQDYKILKGVLEGSLEQNPNNVRIYATSNRRHLVEERFSERQDAVNAREVLEEKLSLSSRFGLILTYSTPNQKEYLAIVHDLAQSMGLNMTPEELDSRAIAWGARHINTSGRTAEQLVHYLYAEQKQFQKETAV